MCHLIKLFPWVFFFSFELGNLLIIGGTRRETQNQLMQFSIEMKNEGNGHLAVRETRKIQNYNNCVLNMAENKVTSVAKDIYTGCHNVEQEAFVKQRFHKMSTIDKGRLPYEIIFILGKYYMLTTNVDVSDGLMDKLISLKLEATATIMTNRVKGFIFKKDNAMNNGESEEVVRSDGKLCITKWRDNRSVMMLSTAFGKQSESNVLRWNKLEKRRVDISCPNVVKSYNEHMGGVDVCDQMMEYYRSFFRTRK
jgi:hypothetical protein